MLAAGGAAPDRRGRTGVPIEGAVKLLTRSFIHVPGVGHKTERKLWEAGIHCWEDLLGQPTCAPLGAGTRDHICRHIEESLLALRGGDWMFFYRALPSAEQWRLLNLLPARTAYLDIETTGLSPDYHEITCIGVYDGEDTRVYVRGENLEQFADDIERYDLLVTYDGKCFDLPFIRRELGLKLDVPHVDLRYPCASVGLRGGLKGAERLAGISRDESLHDVDGMIAVMLWSEYERTGDRRALDTLIAYNLEDTINLLPLSQVVWNMKLPEQFAELRQHVDRPRPDLPFKADRSIVERLLAEARGAWF